MNLLDVLKKGQEKGYRFVVTDEVACTIDEFISNVEELGDEWPEVNEYIETDDTLEISVYDERGMSDFSHTLTKEEDPNWRRF